MANHSSATVRAESPHETEPSRTKTIVDALKRRALAVLNNKSINPQTRAIVRYAMETHDPWLAELVRRAAVGETIDFSGTPVSDKDDASEEKVETLTEIICRSGDEPETKSAALLVLMAMLENATHPKTIANTAKHFAFAYCSELNVCGMVDSQVAMFERELFAGNARVS